MKVKKAAWTRPDTNNFVISVITTSMPDGTYGNVHKIRAFLKKVKRFYESILSPLPSYLKSPYGGHPAVTRSLVEGLRKLGVPFSYNPKVVNDLSRVVIVLSDAFALKQMIALKQQGYIKYLLAGPNILNDPGAHNGILASPEIDVCITPAEGVCKLHERFLPSLSGRCLPWAAGVDMDFWTPGEDILLKNVLIYCKQNMGMTAGVGEYIDALKSRGFTATVVEYGQYSINEFRELLQSAALMVGFSRNESQGIAWAEAWACNVPTFIWKHSEPTYLGVRYNGSPAPYLSDYTGSFFVSFEEFCSKIDKWSNNELNFEPRKWCCEHMSDEICAKELLRLATFTT